MLRRWTEMGEVIFYAEIDNNIDFSGFLETKVLEKSARTTLKLTKAFHQSVKPIFVWDDTEKK